MVVAHCSQAAEDSAFRGYAFTLDEGRPTFALIHFWPGNAIRVQAPNVLPLGQWSHVTITYDGSSKASGVQIYLDGQPLSLVVERDKLTRDIRHRSEWGDSAATESARRGASGGKRISPAADEKKDADE
jgi:hypothetical protein